MIDELLMPLDSSFASLKQVSIAIDFANLHPTRANFDPFVHSVWKLIQNRAFSKENATTNVEVTEWKEATTQLIKKLAYAFHKGKKGGSVRCCFQREFQPLEDVEVLNETALDQCAQLAQWGLFSYDPHERFNLIEELLKSDESTDAGATKSSLDKSLLSLALYYLNRQVPEHSQLWVRYLDSFSIALRIPPESLESTVTLTDNGLEAGLRVFCGQLAVYTSSSDSFLIEELSQSEINAIRGFALSLILQCAAKLAGPQTPGSANQLFSHLVHLIDKYPMTKNDWFDHSAPRLYSGHCLRKISLIPRIHEVLNQIVCASERGLNYKISHLMDHRETLMNDRETAIGPQRNSIDKIAEALHIFDMLIQDGCSDQEHAVLISLSTQILRSYSAVFIQRHISDRCLAILLKIQDPPLRLIASKMADISCAIPNSCSPLWGHGAWKAAIEYWFQGHTGIPTALDEQLLASGFLQGNQQIHQLLIDATVTHDFLKPFSSLTLVRPWRILNTITRYLHLRNAPWFKGFLEEADRADHLLDKIAATPPSDRAGLLPLLVSLLTTVESNVERLDSITDMAHSILIIDGFILPLQNALNEVAAVFEHLPPGALDAVRNMEISNPLQARVVLGRVDRIIRILREAEDVSRALSPWNSPRSSCFQMF
ncbi:hypothetical protein FRC17_004391 [Serendipita sp. 399]|nr:hypothetical protein FRC17_004391 [Serendipita sp. 399]